MVISSDQNRSLKAMSPFNLADPINQSACGKCYVTKLANEYILLETNSPAQSKYLLETTQWEDIPIKTNAHNSLNFCKEVIKLQILKCVQITKL